MGFTWRIRREVATPVYTALAFMARAEYRTEYKKLLWNNSL
jgi:hypothetical protein